MNSAGRWPPAKATRNPHGVEVKEVLFFEGKFPQLHSISFFAHIFSIFLIFLSDPPHLPLRAIRTENTFSLHLYFPLFRNLKAPRFFLVLYVISFYPLQLLALVLHLFRISSEGNTTIPFLERSSLSSS
ncbi:hypothetical protein CBS147332_8936 [Penicillium roqueforti]|nr:hypothetical protein CBS147332_8936 [Penicillium roqueforti]KAI3098204.1 hypothetical protein CBS147331_8876 [Penicillium roqueforti]